MTKFKPMSPHRFQNNAANSVAIGNAVPIQLLRYPLLRSVR